MSIFDMFTILEFIFLLIVLGAVTKMTIDSLGDRDD